MILEQLYLACLAQASYFIADEETKVAAVVDPRRDVDEYLALAAKHGVAIRHVLLTHFHADFVSGHLELRDRCKATIHLGARARAEYAFSPMKDGTRLDLGPRVRIEALETPGHTPEALSFLVFDRKKDDRKPHAVLTGDTLFLGDVGRPDLLSSAGITAAELAGQLYDSLHEKLLRLPDETLVYPGHGAGSACGKNMSDARVATLGDQRNLNYALRPMARAEFVRILTAELPAAPAYFAHDASLNKKERPTLDESMKRVQPLPLSRVLELQRDGVQVVDTRSPADFEAAHLEGTVNIGLGGKYATWAGSVLDQARPIVLICAPGTESESVVRLGRIGFDGVMGYLEGGMMALASREDLLRHRERMTPSSLADRIRQGQSPLVLDVRAPGEWKASHIEGSLNVPLDQLERRVQEVPRGKPIVVQCKSGYRSSIGASLLARKGIESADLVGGIDAWEASGLPTVKAQPVS